jgi:transposase
MLEDVADELYPETKLLRQIHGVGALTALAFVLTLEDPSRFAKSRQVGPYLGLVPHYRPVGQKRSSKAYLQARK